MQRESHFLFLHSSYFHNLRGHISKHAFVCNLGKTLKSAEICNIRMLRDKCRCYCKFFSVYLLHTLA
jgi:hypothetical protein